MSLWFDHFAVRRRWSSPSHTTTEADIGNFAGLTKDHFLLHTSEEYAKQTEFGTRTARPELCARTDGARMGELDDALLAAVSVTGSSSSHPL